MPEGTRLTRAEDIGALSALWQEVFGDGGELISAFFRLLWRPGYGRVAEEEGRIVSMGFCLPGARAGALDCAYIYAMATAEGERGRGHAARIGRALMADAFSRGADIVATLPADEGLCRWYETRLGMAPLFKKGGEGVTFPESWAEFARVCGAHDANTPSRLWAAARPGAGIDLAPLSALAWEHTFD